MASAMRRTMEQQPQDLRALLADAGAAERAAERLAGRRVLLAGTGTSHHAAEHGALMLREAGVEAWPLEAIDAALYGPRPGPGDAMVVLSHRGTKRYTGLVLEMAQRYGATVLAIGARGAPGVDLATVEPETSAAFTASHLGALLRLAQIATALGARLGDLGALPDAVADALAGEGPGVEPPARLLELTGAGPNRWTAAEGALKARETAYVATQGLSVEQLLHGPSVALREGDALVCLDGGGPAVERLEDVARAAEATGVRVHRVRARELGEPLSIFPLTVAVQRIALELAEALGTNPDSFGRDLPGRDAAWGAVEL